MKSNVTMLSLARALSYEREIQRISVAKDVTVVGYAIKLPELSAIYKQNGFTSPDVPLRHIKIWKELGLVKTFFQDNVIVFVPLVTDYEQVFELTMKKQEYGSSVLVFLPGEATA